MDATTHGDLTRVPLAYPLAPVDGPRLVLAGCEHPVRPRHRRPLGRVPHAACAECGGRPRRSRVRRPLGSRARRARRGAAGRPHAGARGRLQRRLGGAAAQAREPRRLHRRPRAHRASCGRWTSPTRPTWPAAGTSPRAPVHRVPFAEPGRPPAARRRPARRRRRDRAQLRAGRGVGGPLPRRPRRRRAAPAGARLRVETGGPRPPRPIRRATAPATRGAPAARRRRGAAHRGRPARGGRPAGPLAGGARGGRTTPWPSSGWRATRGCTPARPATCAGTTPSAARAPGSAGGGGPCGGSLDQGLEQRASLGLLCMPLHRQPEPGGRVLHGLERAVLVPRRGDEPGAVEAFLGVTAWWW